MDYLKAFVIGGKVCYNAKKCKECAVKNEFNRNNLAEFSKPAQEFAPITQNLAAQEYSQTVETVAVQERTTETATPKLPQAKNNPP